MMNIAHMLRELYAMEPEELTARFCAALDESGISYTIGGGQEGGIDMADKKVWEQVTLCRDCRFAKKIPEFRGTAYEEFVYCNLQERRRRFTDYCSDGEIQCTPGSDQNPPASPARGWMS